MTADGRGEVGAVAYFPEATVWPDPILVFERHEHNLIEHGARLNPNGTHTSMWRCAICTDVFGGSKVGPIPPGYCPCGWVQRKPNRKKCEECKRLLTPPTTDETRTP